MEGLEFLPGRSDEHIAHEKRMVSSCADDTDIDPVSFVPSCVSVNHVNTISRVEVVDGALSVDFPNLGQGQLARLMHVKKAWLQGSALVSNDRFPTT